MTHEPPSAGDTGADHGHRDQNRDHRHDPAAGGLPPAPPVDGPPPPRRRTGWVIGGVIGLVAVLAIGGTALVTQLTSGSDDDPGTETAAGEPGPDGGTGEGAPADDTYGPVPGLCSAVDFSPVFEVMPHQQTATDEETELPTGDLLTQCRFFLDYEPHLSELTVTVSTHPHHDSAKRSFDNALDTKRDAGEAFGRDLRVANLDEATPDPAGGEDLPWQYGALVYDTEQSLSVELLVVEDNLQLEIQIFTTAPTEEAEEDLQATGALLEIAGNIRAEMNR